MLPIVAVTTEPCERDPNELLTGAEIAREYRVHSRTVTGWAREGILPVAAVTPGGRRRYRRRDVEAVLSPKQTALVNRAEARAS